MICNLGGVWTLSRLKQKKKENYQTKLNKIRKLSREQTLVASYQLDNSIGVEIHGDGTVGLDCLVEVNSLNINLNDLSIRDCTCWKRDHIYAGTVC
jgi:hypothetical protein